MPPLAALTLAVELPPSADGRRTFELDPDLCWPPAIQRILECVVVP